MGSLAFLQTIKSNSSQNLTTLGGLDWRHWNGYNFYPSTVKTSGAGISDLTAIGAVTADQTTTARTVSASDPTLSSANSGVFYGANGTAGWGVRLTVAVGTTKRKCYLLIGQFSSAVKVDISLSDSSASAISYTYSASPAYTTEGLLVEFELQANSAGQTATVDITCSTNVDFGRIGVQAITLANASSGTNYTQAVSGSLTITHSAYSRKVTRLLLAQATLAGLVNKKITKGTPLAGSITPSATIMNGVSLSYLASGSITVAGSIAKGIRKGVSGSLTATGNVVKKSVKLLVGSITAVGTFTRKITKFFSGSTSATASISTATRVSKSLTGSTTPSGTTNTTLYPYVPPTEGIVNSSLTFLRRFIGRR